MKSETKAAFWSVLDRMILVGFGLVVLATVVASALHGQAPWQQTSSLTLGLWLVAAAAAFLCTVIVATPLAAAVVWVSSRDK